MCDRFAKLSIDLELVPLEVNDADAKLLEVLSAEDLLAAEELGIVECGGFYYSVN